MTQIATCPVCNEGEFSLVFPVKDYAVSGEIFDILECRNCRVRITHPIPGKNQIDRYYESDEYLPHSETSRGILGFLYRQVQKLMITRKRKVVENVSNSSSGRLLDVGCGTGEFVFEMARSGWKVDGIDANKQARVTAHKRYGIDVKSPGQLKNRRGFEFDVITFWHALEHLHNLNDYLRKIRSYLKNDGFLLVATPNYESFDGDYYQADWAAYDVPRHLYHFNYQSLTLLLQRNGFAVTQIRRLPFDSFYISILSEQYKGESLIRGLWIGLRSFLNALSDPRRCSSIIYILTKNRSAEDMARKETLADQWR